MSQQTQQTHKWLRDYLVATEYRDPITGIALKKTSLLGELVYILHSGMMFNREGEWITPPFPSSRTDEFKASVSYTLDEAFLFLQQAITSIERIPCTELDMIDICSVQTTTVRDDAFFTVAGRLASVFYANGENEESYRNWIASAVTYHGLLNNTAPPTSTAIISKPTVGFHYIPLREDGFSIQPCCYEDIHVKSRNRS